MGTGNIIRTVFNEGGSIRAKTSSRAEVVVSQSDNPRTGASLRVLDSAGGPVIEASTGETYENTFGELKEMFRAFKIYHVAAVACAIVGAVILGTLSRRSPAKGSGAIRRRAKADGFLPNRWGLTLIGLAVRLGGWAHLPPSPTAFAGLRRTGMLELQGGCICCSIQTDLLDALLELYQEFQPDHILIEATGVAEPKAILETLYSENFFGRRGTDFLKVANMVTMVDSENLEQYLESSENSGGSRRTDLLPNDPSRPLQMTGETTH